jgi:hypothetical protein
MQREINVINLNLDYLELKEKIKECECDFLFHTKYLNILQLEIDEYKEKLEEIKNKIIELALL